MGGTWWPYVVLFITVTVSWAGVPAVGPAAIGAATVAASQNKLDLTAVVAVSVIASEIGGICGYAIGRRWGTRLMERPGPHQARRKKVEERGERLYARWGGLAVFFTPGIVSGTARMSPYAGIRSKPSLRNPSGSAPDPLRPLAFSAAGFASPG